MVAHRSAPRWWQLRGTDVHATVELHGVGVDHLATQTAGQLHRKVGFAGAGRANYREGARIHPVRTRIGGCGATATRTITAAG
jgi:hypothetical protein